MGTGTGTGTGLRREEDPLHHTSFPSPPSTAGQHYGWAFASYQAGMPPGFRRYLGIPEERQVLFVDHAFVE